MKKTNDLTILLLVFGLFMAFIGAVYYIRDSAGVLKDRSRLGMSSYEVQKSSQKSTEGKSSSVSNNSVSSDSVTNNSVERNSAERNSVETDKPQKVLPAKIVLGIDALLLSGLMLGLPLIFQGRLKFIYICIAVGVFVTIIDLFLRFNFKVV